MKIGVLMMFRDEADILPASLNHWYELGVRNFYLCDNASTDRSLSIAQSFGDIKLNVKIIKESATDWPGRRIINTLKDMAIADGINWLFPADADEFLCLPHGFHTIQDWVRAYPQEPAWGEMPYLNILPNGREYWQEPQRKAFGYFNQNMMISMGNHLIEGIAPTLFTRAYYRHYSLRNYTQWRQKMINYMTAFNQTTFQDHHHAVDYHTWQRKGEAFLKNRWKELTEKEPEMAAPKWL